MRRLLQKIEQWVPTSLGRLGTYYYESLPMRLRYGSIYSEAVKFLDKSQYWSKEQHEEYQLSVLRSLITHAIDHVPFYRERYRDHGISVHDIQSLDDLRKLPITRKQDLQSYLPQLKSENFPSSKFQYHTTGGSTGQPVGLYWEADRTVPLEKAFMRRQWQWAGFDLEKDRSVLLRGIPTKTGKFAEKISKTSLRLSTYYLTPETIEQYIKIIQEFKPIAIQAYPSAAYIIAQHILRRGGGNFPTLKVILCGSENLYHWQRRIIESAFGCRVYSWYGMSEYVALAGECEHSPAYHCYSEYGVVEVINNDGERCKLGESGEIIATGFNNFAFPLIRYQTQDVARVAANQECSCKRNYLLIDQIEGRLQEMIVSKNGNLISMTAINMHSDVFDNLYQFQFYQDTPGKLLMKQLRRAEFSINDAEKIDRELKKKIGDQFEIEYRSVESIEGTARGKARFLIQRLDVGGFE
ncbi:MAG: phenylacetate--CoA ligase family protein [Chlorobi bacterium CHB2]|nr:phenylacetate--CoA ligase family protein [Chlorobi bacterium CHB2]